MLFNNTENYDPFDTDEKDKTMQTGIAANKRINFFDFSTCVKLGVGSGSGSASVTK
jgi:hypothetical protein